MEGVFTSVYAGSDLFRPSFFELIATEQLNEAIRSALRFLLGTWSDLAYTMLLFFLESYHLSGFSSRKAM